MHASGGPCGTAPGYAGGSPDGRIAAWDALRGGAMLLGVVGHATVSYIAGPRPALLWVVHDASTSYLCTTLAGWIHAVQLPLFFLIAGYLACRSGDARGPGGLLGRRLARMLIPFIVGCLILLPIGFVVWASGWLVTDRCTLHEIRRMKFDPSIQRDLYGPAHLWFLEDLLMLTVLYATARWTFTLLCSRAAQGTCRPSIVDRPLSTWVSLTLPIWLACPTALLLAAHPGLIVAHANSFVPNAWRQIYYAIFFAAGVVLYRQRAQIAALFRFHKVHLALSVPATFALLLFATRYLNGDDRWPSRLTLGGTRALVAWLSTFGILGLGFRWLNTPRPVTRYLADASYWVYLCHLPIVGLVQLVLYGQPMAAEIKFVLVVGLTLTLAIGSYQTLVRHTWLGAVLRGVRSVSASSPPPSSIRRAA
jgi:surface polysaccharide O-acyltransferase-like enzyme